MYKNKQWSGLCENEVCMPLLNIFQCSFLLYTVQTRPNPFSVPNEATEQKFATMMRECLKIKIDDKKTQQTKKEKLMSLLKKKYEGMFKLIQSKMDCSLHFRY